MWKPVKDYEYFYEVSEYGNVRALGGRRGSKPKKLKQSNMKGYRRVDLCVGGRRSTRLVHRLVGEAFIPNPYNLPYINHKDGDKANNSVDNLEWCSHQENMDHAWQSGLMAKIGRYIPR
jgi:hypothetical protein